MARGGVSIQEIVNTAMDSIPRSLSFRALDSSEYLHRGGRIDKAATLLGSILNVKPGLCLEDGTVHPVERLRGRDHALERICEMAATYHSIRRLPIGHTTTPIEMELLAY